MAWSPIIHDLILIYCRSLSLHSVTLSRIAFNPIVLNATLKYPSLGRCWAWSENSILKRSVELCLSTIFLALLLPRFVTVSCLPSREPSLEERMKTMRERFEWKINVERKKRKNTWRHKNIMHLVNGSFHSSPSTSRSHLRSLVFPGKNFRFRTNFYVNDLIENSNCPVIFKWRKMQTSWLNLREKYAGNFNWVSCGDEVRRRY